MELKKIDAVSCAKVMGIGYAVIGLLAGGLFSLFAVMGAAIGAGDAGKEAATMGLVFGVGAVIIMPIAYGVMGAISGAIGSLVYNLIAGAVGGIRIELS